MNNAFIAFAALLILILTAGCKSGDVKPDSPTATPLASASPQQTADIMRTILSDAPVGYSWAIFQNAAILKPSGWYERNRVERFGQGEIQTFAVSPENFSENHPFKHGATIQIIAEVAAAVNLKPTGLALALMKDIARKNGKENMLLAKQSVSKAGPLYTIRYRDAPRGLSALIVHKVMIANDAADTLYSFIYESPESEWQVNWGAYGEPIFKQLFVLPLVENSEGDL